MALINMLIQWKEGIQLSSAARRTTTHSMPRQDATFSESAAWCPMPRAKWWGGSLCDLAAENFPDVFAEASVGVRVSGGRDRPPLGFLLGDDEFEGTVGLLANRPTR